MPGTNDKSQLSLVTVAAAAASGLGVLGLVTLAGGVVLWRRFVEMGLPADQAVAIVPTPVLVATGAEFLLPAFGAAALTVLGLVLIRSNKLPEDPPPAAPGRSWMVSVHPPPQHPVGRPWTAEVHAPGDPDPPPPPSPGKPSWWTRFVRTTSPKWPAAFGAAVAVIQIGVAIAALPSIGVTFFIVLVVIAMVDGIVIYASFNNERRIGGVGGVALISFIAVGAFWVGRAYAKTAHDLTVVPMAYSRTEPGSPTRIETGYFVAETSDRVWFASLPQPAGGLPNELREFPRGETEDLEIGRLAGPAQAEKTAARFSANLCQRVISLESAQRPVRSKLATVIPNGCAKPPKHTSRARTRSRTRTGGRSP